MVREKQSHGLLNDNREATGPWPPIGEWLSGVWMPALKKERLSCIAHPQSENVFTQMSAKNGLGNKESGISVRHFASLPEAHTWLEAQKAGVLV